MIGMGDRGQQYNPGRDGRYDNPFTNSANDAQWYVYHGLNCIRTCGVYWSALETSSSYYTYSYNATYLTQIKTMVDSFYNKGIWINLELHTLPYYMTAFNFVPISVDEAGFGDAFFTADSTLQSYQSSIGASHIKYIYGILRNTFPLAQYPHLIWGLINEPFGGELYGGVLTNQQTNDYWYEVCKEVIADFRTNGDNRIVTVCQTPWPSSLKFFNSGNVINDSNVWYELHGYYGLEHRWDNYIETNLTWLKQAFYGTVYTQPPPPLSSQQRDYLCGQKILEFHLPFFIGEILDDEGITAGSTSDTYIQNLLKVFLDYGNYYKGVIMHRFCTYSGVPATGLDVVASRMVSGVP
jgi:hypothetical protein